MKQIVAAMDSLFPSIGTSRGSIASCRQNERNAINPVSRFNPKVNYTPKQRKRNSPTTSSTTSTTAAKKKAPESNSKSLLKDFILLPSPRIESVPQGRFREYLYGNGFAESAVGVSDQMSEEDVKAKVATIFKEKLELIPGIPLSGQLATRLLK